MARAFTAFCCFIVGLQLLVGVPAAVCVGFFALYGGLGPIAIEIHPLSDPSPQMFVHSPTIPAPEQALLVHGQDARATNLTITPPPNIIPPARESNCDNPILETRDQQGSPLAGTVLSGNEPPQAERDQFVAALRKVAAEADSESSPPTMNAPDNAECTALAGNCCDASDSSREADRFVIQQLYEMAERDERAGNYDRADQWRALAREIRLPQKESPAVNPPIESSTRAAAERPALGLP